MGRTACTGPQCLYGRAIPLLPSVPVQYSYTSTPPMGRTACTGPQSLYKGALYLTFYLSEVYGRSKGKIFQDKPQACKHITYLLHGAASQEIPCISRNPKVHYRTHKHPPPISILGQPNPVHILTSHLLEIRPNIIHPSTTRSPQWSLSLRFPHQYINIHALIKHILNHHYFPPEHPCAYFVSPTKASWDTHKRYNTAQQHLFTNPQITMNFFVNTLERYSLSQFVYNKLLHWKHVQLTPKP